MTIQSIGFPARELICALARTRLRCAALGS
jgi:hypothetical protein